MIIRHFIVTTIMGTTLTSLAMAQSSVYDLTLKELMQVKVITAASCFEQKLQRSPSTATVITREEWQAMGSLNLSDVLLSIPGVHVTDPKVDYRHNIYQFRGMSGSFGQQVKILIDGRPFESAQNGGRFYGFDLPMDMFKRIEVIKGARIRNIWC